jgi:hypothetical protein
MLTCEEIVRQAHPGQVLSAKYSPPGSGFGAFLVNKAYKILAKGEGELEEDAWHDLLDKLTSPAQTP